MGLMSYPKMLEWNYHFILCKIPKRVQISEHVQLQRVLLSGECQMVEYICSVTLLQKISGRVKSYKLPGQWIGPAIPTQHLGIRIKRSFIPNSTICENLSPDTT
jgi:hypothetical protein